MQIVGQFEANNNNDNIINGLSSVPEMLLYDIKILKVASIDISYLQPILIARHNAMFYNVILHMIISLSWKGTVEQSGN
jgi:hypothetical protein